MFMFLSKVQGLCCNCQNVEMSKCRNVPIIILLCVKNPVPEWSGFTTWAFHLLKNPLFWLIAFCFTLHSQFVAHFMDKRLVGAACASKEGLTFFNPKKIPSYPFREYFCQNYKL